MRAEGLATPVAVEHRRQYVQRQGGGVKQRARLQRAQNDVAELPGHGVVAGELLIVCDVRALVSRRRLAIDPLGVFEQTAGLSDLFRSEDVGNGEKHGLISWSGDCV